MEIDTWGRLFIQFCRYPGFRNSLRASDPVLWRQLRKISSAKVMTVADIRGLEFKTINRSGHRYYDADQVDEALDDISLSMQMVLDPQKTL